MDKRQIKSMIDGWEARRPRTLVIIDFANVEKWKDSTGWVIDVGKLAKFVRKFAHGSQELRRFYFGEDYGPKGTTRQMLPWSNLIHSLAKTNNLLIVTKRVKYIQGSPKNKKCDLDIEMTLDMIKLRDSYDYLIVFSGDGDMATSIRYMVEEYSKKVLVFAARDHLGAELIDLKKEGLIDDICYINNFEYRLDRHRHTKG